MADLRRYTHVRRMGPTCTAVHPASSTTTAITGGRRTWNVDLRALCPEMLGSSSFAKHLRRRRNEFHWAVLAHGLVFRVDDPWRPVFMADLSQIDCRSFAVAGIR